MAIASVIVETEVTAVEAVTSRLNGLPNTTVYGSKENQIVTVIEAESVSALSDGLARLSEVDRVVGVFPVYASVED